MASNPTSSNPRSTSTAGSDTEGAGTTATTRPEKSHGHYGPNGEYVPGHPDDVVRVCHGYGTVPADWRNLIDRVLFVGGISRELVPYQWVLDVRRRAPGFKLFSFHPEATTADYARVCGLSPDLLNPSTQAALLSAIQPSAIADVLGRERMLKLAEAMLAELANPPSQHK